MLLQIDIACLVLNLLNVLYVQCRLEMGVRVRDKHVHSTTGLVLGWVIALTAHPGSF